MTAQEIANENAGKTSQEIANETENEGKKVDADESPQDGEDKDNTTTNADDNAAMNAGEDKDNTTQNDDENADTNEDDSNQDEDDDGNDDTTDGDDAPNEDDRATNRGTARVTNRWTAKNLRRRTRRLLSRQHQAYEMGLIMHTIHVQTGSYQPQKYPMHELFANEFSRVEATIATAGISIDADAPFNNDALCFFPAKLSCPPAQELRVLLKYATDRKRFPSGKTVLQTLMTQPMDHLPVEARPTASPIVDAEAFTDSGAACSVIHAKLAQQLNLLVIKGAHGVQLIDVNKRIVEHNQFAYVQLNFPGVAYRQVILCVVLQETPHQFLLGSADQKELGIQANLSTRQVLLGPSQAPYATIPMIAPHSHMSSVSLPKVTSTYLGPKVHREEYPDQLQKSIARLRHQLPSLACLYGGHVPDGHPVHAAVHQLPYESGPGTADRTSHGTPLQEIPDPASIPSQVYAAFLASMETHPPELIDLTKEQLPPDPVQRLPVDIPDSIRDPDAPDLPTGAPDTAHLNPRAQALSDKFDWLYSEVLKEVQQTEQAAGDTVQEREHELREDIERLILTKCTQTLDSLRPPEFPPELWQYVEDHQKPLIQARFAQYPDANRAKLVKDIIENLDIYDIPVAKDLFRAQALANLDAFGHPDPENPPTIPGYEYKIEVTDSNPVYHKPQRFNQTETAFLEARIAELKGYGKLEDSSSQYNTHLCCVPYHDRITKDIAEWGANAVTEMFKPENHAKVATWYRLTNNFKPINAITKRYHFPMPDMADVLHHTKGSRYWSITDIKDAFFTVHMEEASREYTTFTTPGGRYQFTVMPMGAQNSPMFWSKIATETFSHIPKSRLINFIDDNTNHAKRFYMHYETQQEMYDAMRSKKMVCKVSKSHFLYPSAKILGHIMSEYGRTPDPEKVQPIMDMIPPRSVAELRSILGLINVNKDYLPLNKNYLGPLEELLKKDADVVQDWRPEYHGKAFQEAKLALTSAPCLLTLDITKPFVLHVDACRVGRGIGAVLLQQNHKGDWRPVAYYSYRLTEGERTRCATELEAMALVYAIKYWSPYLRVQEFTAIVDHHALVYLVSQPAKTSNVRILNWISELHAYRFNIHHRAGRRHLDADAVSRLLQYRDLEEHDAMHTVDWDVPDISGPATAQDILRLHRLIGAYSDQVDSLRDELETMRQDKMNQVYTQLKGTADQKSQDLRERLSLLRKMSHKDDGDYWRLITSPEYQDMLGRQQGEGTGFHGPQTRDSDSDSDSDSDEHGPTHREPDSNNAAHYDDNDPNAVSEPHDPVMPIAHRLPPPVLHEYMTRSRTRNHSLQSHTASVPDTTIPDDMVPAENPLITVPPKLPKAMLRRNVVPPPPRRRQYIAQHTKPLDVPTMGQRDDDIDTEHPQVRKYKDLEWKIFQDPITTRVYRVVLVYYDHEHNAPAAYRKVLDDMPPHPFDSFPWRIEGSDGIQELITRYEDNQMHSAIGPIVAWPKNEQEMLMLQRMDPNWQPMADKLTHEEADSSFNYTPTRQVYMPRQRDGSKSALRVYDPRYGKDPETDRIVLPASLVYTLLQLYHDQNGHSGVHRATDTVKLKYWWPSYRDDIATYVQSCQFCRWSKANTLAAPLPVQKYNAPSRPWEVVHIDLMGPFPVTLYGNRYVLTAKCALTGAIELAPLPDKKPLPVSRELIDRVYLRHGSPRLLFSDQGLEFLNKVVAHVSALFQIKHVPTTAGNPQANGLVEAHNKESKRQLTAFTNARQDDWDTFLAVIQFAYMTTVSTRTGYTPFFLLHGREASQPHETWIGAFAKIASIPEYIKRLVTCLQVAWQYAGEAKEKQVDTMNKVPVKRMKFVEYEVGDRFYLGQHPSAMYQDYADPKRTKQRIAPKLQFRWVGPYTITRKFSPVLYEAAINGELRAVHALQMKPDPTSKYYNLHRKVFKATEPRKEPQFNAQLTPTGRPKVPMRLHKKLLSPDKKAENTQSPIKQSPLSHTKPNKHNKQTEEDDISSNSSSDEADDESSQESNDSSEDLDADI